MELGVANATLATPPLGFATASFYDSTYVINSDDNYIWIQTVIVIDIIQKYTKHLININYSSRLSNMQRDSMV